MIATYSPATAVGQELACRLASLLWRLQRATAIETGLFSIQAGTPLDLIHDDRLRRTFIRAAWHLFKTYRILPSRNARTGAAEAKSR